MSVVFASDLHLEPRRPGSIEQFTAFCERVAREADRLYVLGDLFEAWIGDDDDDAELKPILAAMRSVADRGVACFFMHGNRDFLVGEGFAEATGCRLMDEFETIEAHGRRILLTHGDLLCTDDERYMQLRATIRDPAWRAEFLAKPLAERRGIAEQLRDLSKTETADKAEQIMDVNQGAVEQVMREHGVAELLHGHTHRPAIHRFTLDGEPVQRVVLGDWYERPTIARLDDSHVSCRKRGLTELPKSLFRIKHVRSTRLFGINAKQGLR